MKTKKCTGKHGCGKIKPISEFHKNKSRKDGHRVYCKTCVNKIYEINKVKIAKHHQEWYIKNKKKIAKINRKWRVKNKAKIAEHGKEYYNNNKVKTAKRNKKRYSENKERILEQIREYKTKKYKTDIRFKILQNLRGRINSVLHGNNKSLRTMFLVGCEIDYLMYHIQKKFTKGMSWDNYGLGGWEMDHIKPCSKFDLSKKSEQLKCFNYTNIQPLWAEDNLKKGNKYNG